MVINQEVREQDALVRQERIDAREERLRNRVPVECPSCHRIGLKIVAGVIYDECCETCGGAGVVLR